jgi:hypothetical protein
MNTPEDLLVLLVLAKDFSRACVCKQQISVAHENPKSSEREIKFLQSHQSYQRIFVDSHRFSRCCQRFFIRRIKFVANHTNHTAHFI